MMSKAPLLVLFFTLSAVTALSSAAGAGDETQPKSEKIEPALQHPDPDRFTLEKADSMLKAATGGLAPVYEPLASQIVERFELARKPGVGIDIGGGPGTLVVELAKKTERMYWINSDVNANCFGPFSKLVEKAGVAGRTGFVFADARALPFRDAYADVVVSRGSLQFWGPKREAFSEILRVLKPGGRAFIGRGFAEKMPLEIARQVRKNLKGGPKYDPDALETELRSLMDELDVAEWRILRPRPSDGGEPVNYGVWVEFAKPAEAAEDTSRKR